MQRPETTMRYTWHNTASADFGDGLATGQAFVVGLGKLGTHVIARLIEMKVPGVECITAIKASCTRDLKASQDSFEGYRMSKGRKAGQNRIASEESKRKVEERVSSADLVFVAADMADQGTDALKVAEIVRRKGALTVGVVTTALKSRKQAGQSAEALAEMRKQCDTVIVVDNEKLRTFLPRISGAKGNNDAPKVIADVIKDIVETISSPSLINLDVADFKAFVKHGGMAALGLGESSAQNRAEEAVRNALSRPLLDVDCSGATGALVHVIGDERMTVEEANRVGEIVAEMMDDHAFVVWGARVNPKQEGKLKVTLVMTGVGSPSARLSRFSEIAPQLFEMESQGGVESQLHLDLNLYQMEDF